MQRRTIWDQSTSNGLTSVRGLKGTGGMPRDPPGLFFVHGWYAPPLCALPADGVRRTAISGASILRRDGPGWGPRRRPLSLGWWPATPAPSRSSLMYRRIA